MDGSKGLKEVNFKLQLDLVRLIIQSFKVSKEEVHFAIAVAADKPEVVIHLDEYTETTSLQEAVEKISYPAGRRLIGKAILVAKEELFARARAGVPKVLITFLGGRSKDSVEEPSTKIKKDGVRIVVVGMQRKVVETQLVTISSKPEFVIIQHVVSYLTAIIAPLVDKLNEGI